MPKIITFFSYLNEIHSSTMQKSLNNKPCLVVIVLHVIWYDFGIIPVWNATSDRMISQIIPDFSSIIESSTKSEIDSIR